MITVTAHLRIRPGCLAAFCASSGRLIELAKTEPDTLMYEYHIDEPGLRCLILEVYSHSTGMMAHLAHGADIAMAGVEAYDVEQLHISGDINDEIRAMFTSQWGDGGAALVFYDHTLRR